MNDSPKFGSVISSRQQIIDVFIVNFNKWNTNCTLNFLNPQFIKQMWQCSRNNSRIWILKELKIKIKNLFYIYYFFYLFENLRFPMKMTIRHAFHPPWWTFCLFLSVHKQIQCSYSLPALRPPVERQQLCRHPLALNWSQRPDQS